MRFKAFIAAAVLLAISAPAFAQDDYTEFVSKEDFFTITFPGKPVVTDGTWLTEYFVNLPAKIYTVNGVSGKHTLTVVDYTPVERVLVEKATKCPPGAETCIGVGDTGYGYWKNDVRQADRRQGREGDAPDVQLHGDGGRTGDSVHQPEGSVTHFRRRLHAPQSFDHCGVDSAEGIPAAHDHAAVLRLA
jgi:hypothetical protein